MPRQSIPALGRLAPALACALALIFGPAARSASAADTPPGPATEKAHAAAGAAAPHAAEAGEAHAAHAAEAQPNILEPQISLSFWTVVVFLGLLFVLGKFAWGPLLAALHQREEHLEHVLLETERARNESEAQLAAYRRQMAEAEDRARALLDEARAQARADGDELIQKARAEAEAEKLRARREIETARDNALSEIWSKTADLAVAVAGKVLAKDLGPDDHRRLVASAIEALPASPTAANGHGSASA